MMPGNIYDKPRKNPHVALSYSKGTKFEYNDWNNIFIHNFLKKKFLVGRSLVLGKTDDNMPWSECFEVIHDMDKKVLQGKSFTFIEQIRIGDYYSNFFHTKKFPRLDTKGVAVGIEGRANLIDETPLFQLLNLITNDTKKFGSQKTCQYLIKDRFKTLTSREMDCLFHLVRGKGIKIIGAALSISPRTVETHISHIKQKLHCHTTSQLIDKAFTEGFISIIPQELILKQPIILDES